MSVPVCIAVTIRTVDPRRFRLLVKVSVTGLVRVVLGAVVVLLHPTAPRAMSATRVVRANVAARAAGSRERSWRAFMAVGSGRRS